MKVWALGPLTGFGNPNCLSHAVWRSRRGPAKPPRKEDLVDLASTFGIRFGGDGDDTDSSDAEFAPEDGEVDSEGT